MRVRYTTKIDFFYLPAVLLAVIAFMSPVGYAYELKPVIMGTLAMIMLYSVSTGVLKTLSLGEIYAAAFAVLATCLTLYRDLSYSIPGLIDLVAVFGLFISVHRISEKAHIWRFLGYAYVYGALFASAQVIYNWLNGIDVQSRFSANDLVNANFVAYSIVTALPVVITLLWTKTDVKRKDVYFTFFVIAILGFGIFLTGCRGAALGLLFGIVIYVMRSLAFRPEAGIRLVAVLLMLSIAINFVLPDNLKDRFYLVEAYAGQDVTSGRVDQWPIASDLIAASPVLGNGADTFASYSAGNVQVHNVFLGVLVGFGAVGTMLYLMVVLQACGLFQTGASSLRRWSGLLLFFVWLPIALTGVWAYSIPAFFAFAWVYRVSKS